LPGCGFWPGDGVRLPHDPCVLVAELCDETDPEYELRYHADEEYVRELIDRIDEMSLRGVKLCGRCTEKPSGKGKGKLGKAQCTGCDRKAERHCVCRRSGCGKEDELQHRVKPMNGN
jgi:hypothetical protein